jgi:murein L,D-transpeptidase YafK
VRKVFLVVFVLIIVVFFYGFFSFNKPLDKSTHVDRIIVEKSKRRMKLYSNGELLKTYKISLGRNPIGGKSFEGDNRTPEGIYYIKDKYVGKFHKSLYISYPNQQDRSDAQKIGKNPGGSILIHGLGEKFGWIGKMHLLIDWTAGCIAVTNKEIDEIYADVPIGTPIEIIK